MKKRIRLTIKDFCLKQGIQNAYQLQKKLGLYPTTARNAFNSDGQRVVRLDLLERLCEGLDCDLSDLITFETETERPAKTSRTK